MDQKTYSTGQAAKISGLTPNGVRLKCLRGECGVWTGTRWRLTMEEIKGLEDDRGKHVRPTTTDTPMSRARLAKGLTLQALGDAMGVSRQAVHQWEQGQTRPRDMPTMAALANALGKPLDEILEWFVGEAT